MYPAKPKSFFFGVLLYLPEVENICAFECVPIRLALLSSHLEWYANDNDEEEDEFTAYYIECIYVITGK